MPSEGPLRDAGLEVWPPGIYDRRPADYALKVESRQAVRIFLGTFGGGYERALQPRRVPCLERRRG
jgi:hypothetical protein